MYSAKDSVMPWIKTRSRRCGEQAASLCHWAIADLKAEPVQALNRSHVVAYKEKPVKQTVRRQELTKHKTQLCLPGRSRVTAEGAVY